MKTKLKWRLSKLPTPSELVELVNNKLVTQEEAKEILFDQVTKEDADVEALKKEIEFLRKVVDELSKSKTETVRVIEKYVQPNWTWSQPYLTWCAGSTYTTSGVSMTNVTSGISLDGGGGNTTVSALVDDSLASLKTF